MNKCDHRATSPNKAPEKLFGILMSFKDSGGSFHHRLSVYLNKDFDLVLIHALISCLSSYRATYFQFMRPFIWVGSVTGIKLMGICETEPEGLLTITHCLSRHLSRTLPPFLAPLAINYSPSHSLTKTYNIYTYVNCDFQSPSIHPYILEHL